MCSATQQVKVYFKELGLTRQLCIVEKEKMKIVDAKKRHKKKEKSSQKSMRSIHQQDIQREVSEVSEMHAPLCLMVCSVLN